jgi:c-di-GMP-related signal transduction protein
MNVIAHAFCHFGSSAVVGESKAFINFNAQLLMSNVIEALPRDRVVIELLETVDIDDELIRRCRDLKAQDIAWRSMTSPVAAKPTSRCSRSSTS